jgi:NADH dehydrogenase
MTTGDLHAVTGAFGFTGRYLTRRLLDAGIRVRTLTNSPWKPDPFGGRVEVRPLAFDDPAGLAESLRGVRVLHNTYWVRFNHWGFSHVEAVRNTLAFFAAAKQAGVERVVHVSIANASDKSRFEYFRSKAKLEQALQVSGLSYAIVRPALLFGPGDILINNIAWMLRHLPVLGIFGDGRYRLRPVHVDDMAALMAEQADLRGNIILDAVGPEAYAYRDLVNMIGDAIGYQRPLVRVPVWGGLLAAHALGFLLRDVVLTRAEIGGLMAGLLDVEGPATGATRLSAWVEANSATLGTSYASELARRKSS